MMIKWYKSILSLQWWQQLIYFTVLTEILIILALMLAITKTWFPVFLGVMLLLILIFRLKFWANNRFWKKLSSGNIFIFGPKGYGKDQLMQLSVIKKYKGWFNRNRRKALSNIEDQFGYGYGTQFQDPVKVFSLFPNTYKNLIEHTVQKLIKNPKYEGRDYYLSDASTEFPSHADTELKKAYPSFGMYYALSRQLYNMNIIVNTQVGGRLWILLREQVQDGYVEALGTIGWGKVWSSLPILRNYVFVKARYYQKQQSAELGLLPFSKVALINNSLDHLYLTSGGATKEQYEATNGKIREFTVLMKKKHIKYDTRYFEKVFFTEESIKQVEEALN